MPTALQPLRWHAFHLPKRGNSEQEYEDAFAGNAPRGRFAVADGASESSFAGLWARLLARGFVAEPNKPWEVPVWLEPLRQRWADEVGRSPLPWYAEVKREEGAFSTLLGLAFRRPNHWRALAVGDSCLFLLRAGRLVASFPVTRSDEFGNQPSLLGSRGEPMDAWKPPAHRRTQGKWQTGDVFLLMTDALAQWFLSWQERKKKPWDVLKPLLNVDDPVSEFSALVTGLRESEELRNDDVTLVLAESPAASPRRPASPKRERGK